MAIRISQLRALRLQRSRFLGILPRLRHIQEANLSIYNCDSRPGSADAFQEGELFNEILPLVADVFCGLESLFLTVVKLPITAKRSIHGSLTEQLTTKVKQLFSGLKQSRLEFIHFSTSPN